MKVGGPASAFANLNTVRTTRLEPITHFLSGAVISRAGLNRKTALATTTLVLAAEAPDIDVIAYFRDPVYGFAQHRGYTHTLVGAPFVAALVVAVVYLGYRLAKLRNRRPDPRSRVGESGAYPRWGLLFCYACSAVLVHILLDFTNNYGVRPFMPFQNRWYSWDIVFIVEPLLYVAFLGGLLLPVLFGLVHQEIGVRRDKPAGRLGAILAIIGVLCIWGTRSYEHRRAIAALDARLYQGEIPLRVSAYPYAFNPFHWYGVVETRSLYARMIVDSLTPEVDPNDEAQVRYKTQDTPVTKAAEKSYLGRVYLDWAQYPFIEIEKLQRPQSGYIARFFDLRFQYPGRKRGTLGAYALISPQLQVTAEWFGRQGSPPGGEMPGSGGGSE